MERNKHRLRVKVLENIYQANDLRHQTEVAIFISDKVDYKFKLVKRDKVGHFILIKGATNQEKITVINL
jgi:hypothetical protein